MKRNKIMFVIAIVAILAVLFVACDEGTQPEHTHTYGAWSITTQPTETATGTATRTCACGDVETATVAQLSDASVWTVEASQDATHTSKGFKVYKSAYGTVTTTSDATDTHTYGAWTLTKNPTTTETGTATRSCACGDVDTATVAVLTDSSVWTVTASQAATYTSKGFTTYQSEYGTFTLEYDQVAHEHRYSGYTTYREPSCEEDGVKIRYCYDCEYQDVVILPATGHVFGDTYFPYYDKYTQSDDDGDIAEETNEDSVGHAKKCMVCGEFDTEQSPYVAHTYGTTYLTAEKDNNGTEIIPMHDCTVCGYKHVDESENNGNLGYLEYTWTKDDSQSKVATYNEAGYTVYKQNSWTYRLEVAKLVAPYDGKTYHAVELYVGDDVQIGKAGIYSWTTAVVTIDAATSKGTGTYSPLEGENSIKMIDAATGQIEYTIGATTYAGYVDMTNGIIVLSVSEKKVYVLSPLEDTLKMNSFAGSTWNGFTVGSYNYDCAVGSHTFNFYVEKDGNDVSGAFGVKFVDANGAQLAADACYNASYVKVLAEDGTKIIAYAKNAEGNFQETDGKEGTYNDANYGEVVLNGIGGATVGGEAGTYSYNEAGYYELYVGTSKENATAYYTFTLTDGAIALTKPMTAITYVSAYGEDTIGDAYKSVNNNVKFTLPTIENVIVDGKTLVLVGWTIEGQEGYVTEYTPDGTAVTLTAVWKEPVTITIIGGAEGDPDTVSVPYGEAIYSKLPTYGDDLTNRRSFVKWVVDSNGDGKYTEADDEDLDEDLTAIENITVIALWDIIPDYVGTYYGTELWYLSNGNSGGKTLTIDKQGNITGLRTGTVTAYDPTTQKITWTNGTFYFDADAKIILGIYDNNNIGYDYYFLGQDMPSTGKVVAQYGVYAVKVDSTLTSYYAQFIQAKTALGDNTNVFTYGNKIYSGVEIKDALGNALVVDKSQTNSIANAASVVVYKDGNVIFARAAAQGKSTIGESTSSTYLPRELDAYFGTYTCEGKDDLVFGGTGEFAWGTKTGTYTVTNADTKTFDLYVVSDGKNVEYYTATLDGSTYTVEKPMVTITFVVPEGINKTIAEMSVNANIGVALPDGTVDGYVFNGYYTDKAFAETGKVADASNFATSKSVTLYAKYSTPVTITYHYNDGTTANKAVVYSKDETQSVADPSRAKYAFGGWYLDDTTFKNAWNGIADSTKDVYAKWDECAYAQTYTFVYVSSLSTKSGTSYASKPTYSTTVTFDGTTGKGTFDRTDKKETLPFFDCSSTNSSERGWGYDDDDDEPTYLGYGISVTAYDATTGKITFTVVKYNKDSSKNTTYTFYGIVDSATGVIVASYTKDTETISKFGFFMPEGYSVSATNATTWDGKNSVLDYVVSNGTSSETHTLLIENGNVHFDAKVVDINGAHIACGKVYNAECVLIYASQDATAPLYSLGYDGTQLVALDGYQGTYKDGDDTITLNGMGKITFSDGNTVGTYTVAEFTKEGYDASFYAIYQSDSAAVSSISNKLFINTTDYKYAMETNNVEITYVNDGGDAVVSDSALAGIKTSLSTPAERTDKVFRGWYVQNDADQTLVSMTEFVTMTDVTLVAKWDVKVTLTIVYGNELKNKTVVYGAGDALNMSQHIPEFTNGKAFSKWYTTADEGVTKVDFTATTITEDTTVYCEWVEAVQWYGSYIIANVYSEFDKDLSSYTLSVAADGTVSGTISGKINDDGTAIVDGSYSRFMAFDGNVIICPYRNNPTLGTDFYFAAQADTGTQIHQYKHLGAANKVVVSYVKDGQTVYALVWEDKVYDNVTWTSTAGEITADKLCDNVATLTFYDRTGQAITLA